MTCKALMWSKYLECYTEWNNCYLYKSSIIDYFSIKYYPKITKAEKNAYIFNQDLLLVKIDEGLVEKELPEKILSGVDFFGSEGGKIYQGYEDRVISVKSRVL